jgi:hypothetical protein
MIRANREPRTKSEQAKAFTVRRQQRHYLLA